MELTFNTKFRLQIIVRLSDIPDMIRILDNNKFQFHYTKNEDLRFGDFKIHNACIKTAEAIKKLMKQEHIKYY